MKSFLYALLFLIFGLQVLAQDQGVDILRGKIIDETGLGLPMAEVYVKDLPELRTRADVEGNYIMRLQDGEYHLVFQAMGYEPREVFVAVKEGENIRNIQLFPLDIKELEEFAFSVKKSNPGRDIILKVVEQKDALDFNQYPYKCNVYIRGKEKRTDFSKSKKKDEDDDFKDEEELKRKKLGDLNNTSMVEIELERNFAPPNYVKEFRNAFEKRGDISRIYYTTTAKSNINFFKNMLYLNDLSESPIQSPISNAGILSYKYRLVEKIERENQPTLNKIKITPRNTAVSTLEGFVYVQDETYLVEKIDLTIVKGNLYLYDYFQIIQHFDISSDTLCVLAYQELNYGVKYKNESFESSTIANYSNYEFHPNFPKKYFGNEVAITTKEAYNRDSTYWTSSRMTPLTREEMDFIKKRDSIENLFTKTTYLDSIDSVFNQVNFWKVVWFGIDHRNRAKRTQWTISSIAAMTRPVYIAGPRIGPDFDFFKKWEDERTFDSYSRIDVGLLNADIKGNTRIRYKYNPFNFATAGINFKHDYDLIRTFDAFSQILLRENFIEATEGGIYHQFELFNGFTMQNNISLAWRRPVKEGTNFITWLDEAIDNNMPPVFEPYNALITDMTISYTPFQKYMREPYRKVILGSNWPTFYLYYEKGIEHLLRSEINHDFLRLGIRQDFKIGTLGTSSYHATSGKFLNAKRLQEFDYKFHRRSDPIWFSNPLFTFQDLDTSLPTLDWYFEAHFIHHFNGALMNKIPFMKQTRISSVLGGGYLYVPEHNWQHYEFFFGLERIFKFSRRRLRIGLYAVFSDGNQISPRTTGKISFALLDRRNMKFNF
ncbi:MAG: carboxypeptidase-like regulatory domain-containing protein [Crocinitomicaceae bacterium]|nr:carboxypeptidase-like regulatory domain-containing protein [Crocinitomicaceae bacterium]